MTKLLSAMAMLALGVALSACSSNCENAGISVDDAGNIVVYGENGYISPNSSILDRVKSWPRPPNDEASSAYQTQYALGPHGSMYVLESTATHPNLLYRVDLGNGRVVLVGNRRVSLETGITASARYAYSVRQFDPTIYRAALSSAPELVPYIRGARTRLKSPLGVAVDANGRVCAIDGDTLYLLCYAPGAHGDAPPEKVVNLARVLGFAQIDALAFDRSNNVVVSGSSDPNGLRGQAIAVLGATLSHSPVLRKIAGSRTRLSTPYSIAVDARGDVLTVQNDTHELLAFSAQQRGNVSPTWVRPANASKPYAIAVDNVRGDIALLGDDGISYFRRAAYLPPARWPVPHKLATFDWDIAFGGDTLVAADEYGGIAEYATYPLEKRQFGVTDRVLSLGDPDFLAVDPTGNVYVASTNGAVTELPDAAKGRPDPVRRSIESRFSGDLDDFAVGTRGYMYALSSAHNAIVVVAPDGRPGVLTGSKTGLNHPQGIAVGRDGSLLVANTSDANVLIFPQGSDGNVAPSYAIAGPSTNLVAPQALAVDAVGKLYVFDGPTLNASPGALHYVRVFDADSRGNARPLRSYPVKTRCWADGP